MKIAKSWYTSICLSDNNGMNAIIQKCVNDLLQKSKNKISIYIRSESDYQHLRDAIEKVAKVKRNEDTYKDTYRVGSGILQIAMLCHALYNEKSDMIIVDNTIMPDDVECFISHIL